MSTELGEFFSLIGKARQEKEEEFQSLVGEINIDSLFAEVKTSVAEDKKKKKKKLEEDKKKKAKEKRQVKALESWLYSEPKQEEKLEIEDANGDVAFEVVDLITPEPLKPSEPVVEEQEEPEEISEETEDIPEDTVDHALKILETIKSKEEVQENVGDPEIIKIRSELEYLKNLVNAQGGGGEVRLEFLDDVDRDTALVDGKFLKYQASTKTFVGADASGGGGGDSDYASVAGIATFATTAGIATDAVSAGFAKTAGISTVSQGLTGTPNVVIGITTAQRLSGFKSLVGAASSTTETFVTTVDSKTTNHRYHGTGSGSAYFLDGIESPFLTLLPGKTYRFDQSDSSNGGHPLRFYLEADKTTAYTTNVTTNGTAGSSGAYTEILVTDSTPLVLHYQCSSHGYMGNSSFLNSNLVDTPFQITARSGINVSGIVTATSFIGDITGDVTGDVTGNADTATLATTATNAQGLTGTPNITVGIITAASAEFSGNVTIGGTITYEDVKNVDSVGLVTARTGVRITSGGLVVTAGVSTLGFVTSSNIFSTGIVTASSFVGDITGDVTGNADTATLATTATYAVNAGLATEATYAVTAGLATEATYAVTAGLATEATYAVTAGLATEATYAVSAGLATEATYAVTAGLATEATFALTAGISTFATTAGIATDVIGGIASVTTLDVTGVSTLPAISGQNINVSGIITANAFIGDGTGLTGVGGGSVISGITIREEGSTVGTAGTVVSVNFVGDNITATASGAAATITASSTPTFDSVSVGVATVSSALYVPKYTTTARDAATFGEGAIIFNTTTKKMNFYDGTNWIELPGVTLGLGMGVF